MKKSLSKLNKIFIAVFSCLAIVALSLGLGLGLGLTQENKDDNTKGYWIDRAKMNWEGNGTSSSPYLISTPSQLAGIYTFLNPDGNLVENWAGVYFKQTCDLDMSGYEWLPIATGTEDSPSEMFFSGTYNGGGFKILNLSIATGFHEAGASLGLFGSVRDATIRNVNLVNLSIETMIGLDYETYIGGLVGLSASIRCSNCHVYGSIEAESGHHYWIGGLVGYINPLVSTTKPVVPTLIEYSSNHVNIISREVIYVAGIVGHIERVEDVTIGYCYNAGLIQVEVVEACAGIANYSQGITTTLVACYNYGKIICEYEGISSGLVTGTSTTSSTRPRLNLNQCFNVAKIYGPEAFELGNVLEKAVRCIVTKDDGVAGGFDVMIEETEGIIRTIRDSGVLFFKDLVRYDAWNFERYWELNPMYNDGLPRLKSEPYAETLEEIADTEWLGSGTPEAPYEIYSGSELAGLAQRVNNGENFSDVVFEQTANINLAGYNWTPIGKNSENYFAGMFQSRDFSVQNLTVNNTTSNYQGLFGYVRDAGFRGLALKNVYIVGQSYVGGIVGLIDATSNLANCKVLGGIIIGEGNVGGLIGGSAGTTNINNCYNTADVQGGSSSYCGGIAGNSNHIQLTGCYNIGNVTSTGNYVGGLLGTMRLAMSNCYNTGSVSGKDYVGGLAGSSAQVITNCYNTGIVTGSGNAGGLVGNASGNSPISYSYNKGNVTGGNGVGGIAGVGTVPITNCNNSAIIQGKTYVGGIVGSLNYQSIENSYNTGNINGTTSVGGIVGYFYQAPSITACLSDCVITGGTSVGGIVGSTNTSFNFAFVDCAVYGRLLSSDNGATCGFLIGKVGSAISTSIANCTFFGDVNFDLPYWFGEYAVSSDAELASRFKISAGCYWEIGTEKYYQGSDFSGFTITQNQNNGLPMQNGLFANAIGGNTSTQILTELNFKGFKKYEYIVKKRSV